MLNDEQLTAHIRDELREELSHLHPSFRPSAQLWQDARAEPGSRRSILRRPGWRPHWAQTRVWRGVRVALAVLPAIAVAALAVILLAYAPTHVPAAGNSASQLAVNAPQPNVPPTEWPYLQAAQRATVTHDPACSTSAANEPLTSQGSPGRALLATLGVLRQPGTAADALPQPFSQMLAHGHGFGPTREVFVNNIRRARSVLGATFYIIPAGNILGLRPVPGRCTGEEITALNRELAQLPQSLRAQTLSLQAEYLAWQRYAAAHPQGIALATTASSNSSGGGIAAGWTVADIDRGMAGLGLGGLAIGTGSSRRVLGGSGLHGIVPDGVATVTLHDPARPPNSRPRSITVKVFNNMFVAPDSARQFPPTISWYNARGRLIKTVTLPHS